MQWSRTTQPAVESPTETSTNIIIIHSGAGHVGGEDAVMLFVCRVPRGGY